MVFFIKKYIIRVVLLSLSLHSHVCAQYVHPFSADNYSNQSIFSSAKFWDNKPEDSLLDPLSRLKTIELQAIDKILNSSKNYSQDDELYGIKHSVEDLNSSKYFDNPNNYLLTDEISPVGFQGSVLDQHLRYWADFTKLSSQPFNLVPFDQASPSFEQSFFYFFKQQDPSRFIEPFSCEIDLPSDKLPEEKKYLQSINVGKQINYPENSSRFLSYRDVMSPYPRYSEITSPFASSKYNIFENNFEKTFGLPDSPEKAVEIATSIETTVMRSTRQRRSDWNSSLTYTWEMDDFDPTATHAKLGVTNFNGGSPDSNLRFQLEISANDGLGSLAVLAYGTTGGNAMNDYTESNGFHFMTATNWSGNGDYTHNFTITTSNLGGGDTGIDSWLNGFDNFDQTNLWGVWKNNNHFYLTYNFSSLNYSPVPEPSTYFMTGALFCLIGFNRSSRNALKFILHKTFNYWKTKPNCQDIQKRIS